MLWAVFDLVLSLSYVCFDPGPITYIHLSVVSYFSWSIPYMNRERWHNTTLNPSDSLMLTHLRRVPCFWVACFVQPATSDSLLRPPYLYVVEALDASVPPKKLFPVFNKELLTVLLIRIFYDLDQSSLPPTIIKSSRKTQICV